MHPAVLNTTGNAANIFWRWLTVLSQGELELACEVLWGAAAHAIKSAAQRREWEHGSHTLLLASITRLIAEEGAPPHLLGQYRLASDLHIGFYGDLEFDGDNIRYAKDTVADFVETLESLPPANAIA